MSKFYIVGTPIGNLGDMTFRALETLKLVDVIYCEDTRRSLKLLNHFEIRKPLKSAPYFKERRAGEEIINLLKSGQNVAYMSDAGMPGLADPGAHLVDLVRREGFAMEVIGGISSLTTFIAGLGWELESFRFVGFLPPRKNDRLKSLRMCEIEPVIFFESTHRIESTLELLGEVASEQILGLAKELTKISEAYFLGTPSEVKAQIKSWKGEWVGCLLPRDWTRDRESGKVGPC